MIKSAAIKRIADGKIWTGRRHGDIVYELVIHEGVDYVTPKNFIYGFISESQGFVDRETALTIAKQYGQVSLNDPSISLHSEMLIL